MTTSNLLASSPSPLLAKDRITFLDAVRGIALLGILIINSMGQAQSGLFDKAMNLKEPITGLNYYLWFIDRIFLEGTMRGLFSILFGAGTILLITRLEKTRGHLDAADIYYRRLFWLLGFGLVNAFIFLWVGDILYTYAICGLFLFPFRNISPRKLMIPIFILLAIGTYKFNSVVYEKKEIISKGRIAETLQSKNQTLTSEQNTDIAQWKTMKETLSGSAIQKQGLAENEMVQKATYLKLFKNIRDKNMQSESTLFYEWWWFDTLIFFFVGMALFKSGFLLGNGNNKMYLIVTILGISLGTFLNYWEQKDMYNWRFDQIKFIENTPFRWYEIRRLIQTLGYLGLLILLYKITPFRKILNIFAPVGQMAFTNYLSQSIIMATIFFGFKWYGKLQRYQIYEVVGVVWLFQIIFSTIWMRYFLYGPFEWLWRSLTYLKKQPFLKMKSPNLLETFVEPVRVFAD